MSKLTEIIGLINEGKLLGEGTFAELNCDAILDKRDSTSFDEQWIKAFHEVEGLDISRPSENDVNLIQEVRRVSFCVASKATYQHEIASYISDDFELICKGVNSRDSHIFLCFSAPSPRL